MYKNRAFEKRDRLFVIPIGATGKGNDLEMVTIRELLAAHGEEIIDTAQGWGASWAGIEDDLRKKIATSIRCGKICYGIELAGKLELPDMFGPLKEDIDHHTYADEDRYKPESSLRQIARLLRVELDRFQCGVEINDTLYIPGLIAAGYTPDEIAEIRQLDRRAQGVTDEEEKAAEEAIAGSKDVDTKYGFVRIVHLSGDKCSPVTDRLYGISKKILILCSTGEVDYYGSAQECAELQGRFGGWSGGGEESGFWGGYVDPPRKVIEFLCAAGTDGTAEPNDEV